MTKACVYIYVHTHNGSMHVGSIYVCEQMYTCGKKNTNKLGKLFAA